MVSNVGFGFLFEGVSNHRQGINQPPRRDEANPELQTLNPSVLQALEPLSPIPCREAYISPKPEA